LVCTELTSQYALN